MNLPRTRAGTVHAVHAETPLLLVANVWDAASARRVAAAGARLIATTSAAVAWANGYADGQSMPPQRLFDCVERVVAAVDLPVSVDVEGGYSDDPEVVAAFVERLAGTGVSGINLEDGSSPPELLAGKISAIRARAGCADVFVNARTDVYLRGLVEPEVRVEETIRRGQRYADAGADGLFVPGLAEPDTIGQVVSAVPLPLNLMALPGLPAADRLAALGVRRLSTGPWLAQHAYAALQRAAEDFFGTGSIDALASQALSFAEMDRA